MSLHLHLPRESIDQEMSKWTEKGYKQIPSHSGSTIQLIKNFKRNERAKWIAYSILGALCIGVPYFWQSFRENTACAWHGQYKVTIELQNSAKTASKVTAKANPHFSSSETSFISNKPVNASNASLITASPPVNIKEFLTRPVSEQITCFKKHSELVKTLLSGATKEDIPKIGKKQRIQELAAFYQYLPTQNLIAAAIGRSETETIRAIASYFPKEKRLECFEALQTRPRTGPIPNDLHDFHRFIELAPEQLEKLFKSIDRDNLSVHFPSHLKVDFINKAVHLGYSLQYLADALQYLESEIVAELHYTIDGFSRILTLFPQEKRFEVENALKVTSEQLIRELKRENYSYIEKLLPEASIDEAIPFLKKILPNQIDRLYGMLNRAFSTVPEIAQYLQHVPMQSFAALKLHPIDLKKVINAFPEEQQPLYLAVSFFRSQKEREILNMSLYEGANYLNQLPKLRHPYKYLLGLTSEQCIPLLDELKQINPQSDLYYDLLQALIECKLPSSQLSLYCQHIPPEIVKDLMYHTKGEEEKDLRHQLSSAIKLFPDGVDQTPYLAALEQTSPAPPSLEEKFDALMKAYQISIQVTQGSGDDDKVYNVQCYIDNAYAQLKTFVSQHPEFKNQLPKKINRFEDIP